MKRVRRVETVRAASCLGLQNNHGFQPVETGPQDHRPRRHPAPVHQPTRPSPSERRGRVFRPAVLGSGPSTNRTADGGGPQIRRDRGRAAAIRPAAVGLSASQGRPAPPDATYEGIVTRSCGSAWQMLVSRPVLGHHETPAVKERARVHGARSFLFAKCLERCHC